MNYIFNDFWQQRIAATFQNALDAYPRVLMLRVDLRLPDTPAATDAAVISRFTESLKAKITACQLRKKQEGKRVHPTTLRYVWAREFGERSGKKHYHVVLLLNRESWCGAGDYKSPHTLAGMIKQAWCSALQVDVLQHDTLANFPENPVLWIDRGNSAQLQQALARADYLAKDHTKVTGDGGRNFGCSQG
ncbi:MULTISPECIES: inovirus Gp2 family protein [Enterobacter cloacae complex]|uniref:inovirus Gp2 family protein n=1 Tax=Enterobacteriaceae TaxID=543 RepID=UPI002FFC4B56